MRSYVFLFVLISGSALHAQEASAPPLTDDQNNAIAEVTEGRVLSTVSFLASDELAGRDTPSPELNIAAAYVAARFRGAGLEPLGDDSTYFLNSSLQMTAAPREATVTAGDDRIRVAGVLLGAAEEVDVAASCEVVQGGEDATSGVVAFDGYRPPATQNLRQTLSSIRRLATDFAEQGVKVVLLPVTSDSPLIDVAESLSKKPVVSSDSDANPCAFLLVRAKTSELKNRELNVKCPAQKTVDRPVRNVVGLLRGSDDSVKDEAVLVTAHLDHIGRLNRGDDQINNGADDNASGVTGVLMLADAFAALKTKPRRSIIFATFWGEEKGLQGSKHMASRPPWPLNKITANVNFEMLGRPEEGAEEKAWMTGWQHSNLGSVMNAGSSRVGVEIFDRKDVGEMLYRRSDNYAFVKVGVVAHSFSAGSLHSDYHQPSDEWEKLNIAHMTKVIRGLFAGTLNVANTPSRIQDH